MTNASAMTLVLLMFVAVFLAAFIIILMGGKFFDIARPPKRSKHDVEQHQRAA